MMLTPGMHVEYERAVHDLRNAVNAVEYSLKAPDAAIRRLALAQATDQLRRATEWLKMLDLSL